MNNEEIKAKLLFNPNGDDRIESRQIIGGNTTNLFNLNETKYTWAKSLYRKMLADFWIPEKVNLSQDKIDYNSKLNNTEKKIMKKILSFLTFLDSIQVNNIPRVSEFITAPEVNTILSIQDFQEVIHCFAEDTEILTQYGWKYFRDLNQNDIVAQYHSNGDIDFVKPSEIIQSNYDGKMIHINNGRYDTLITPNHRIVYNDSYTKTLRVKEANKLSLNNHTIPVAGNGIGKIDHLSVRDYLKIAYQADGCLVNNGNFTKDGVCYRFFFKKERKINRILEICNRFNLRYTLKKSKTREDCVNIYVWYPELFNKTFDEYDLTLYSSKWCKDFIKEISIYDGTDGSSSPNIRYINTNKKAIDKVMAIATLANYRVGFDSNDGTTGFGKKALNPKKCYILNFIDKNYICGKDINREEIDYSGKIYCVTVPTGMIVVRYNNRVTISGNSQSYAYIIESVIPSNEREQVYEQWREDTILFERNKYIANIYQKFWHYKTMANFLEVIIANYILESLYFYNGFIFFYNLASRNLMLGTADEIRFIQSDELNHVTIFANIINEIKNEFPDLIDNQLIYDMFKIGCQEEIKWSNHILKDSDIIGLNETNTELYTKYLVNDRLLRIGLEPLFPEANTNPYSSLELQSDSNSSTVKSNFFESKNTNYSISTAIKGWDKI